MTKMNFKILLLFIVFLFMRFFTHCDYLMFNEEAKYLGLTKNFPYHTLYNDELFIMHPPLFTWITGAFHLFFPDYITIMLVSYLCSIITFLVFYKISCIVYDNTAYALLFLIPLTILATYHIFLSTAVLKESFLLMMFSLTVYYLLKPTRGLKYAIPLGIMSGLSFLSGDILLLIISPIILLGPLTIKNKPRTIEIITPVVISMLLYSVWLLVRLDVFISNEYAPVGIDGTIEKVNEFTISDLLSPLNFQNTMKIIHKTEKQKIYENVHDLVLLFRFGRSITPLKVITLLLILSYLTKPMFRGWRRIDVFFTLVFISSLLPVLGPDEDIRYLVQTYLPLSFFFAEGISSTTGILKNREHIFNPIQISTRFKCCYRFSDYIIVLVSIIIVMQHIFLNGNSCLFFNREMIMENTKTAEFLNTLQGEGVMARFGDPPELAYLTDKRVIALPEDNTQLDYFVRKYDISYIVYDSNYAIGDNAKLRDYINQSNKYKLLKVIHEDKPWPKRVYVYETKFSFEQQNVSLV